MHRGKRKREKVGRALVYRRRFLDNWAPGALDGLCAPLRSFAPLRDAQRTSGKWGPVLSPPDLTGSKSGGEFFLVIFDEH